MLGHCSHLVEFELVGEDGLLSAQCARKLARSLERMMGIEDIHVSRAAQCILVAFHPALITADDLGEALAELGYVVRPAKASTTASFPRGPFLH